MLRGIWQLSFWLALTSIVIMLLLVLRRAWQHHQQKNTSQRRKVLAQIMQAGLNPAVPLSTEALPSCRRSDLSVLCSLALDMLRPLRGSEVMRITAMLDIWNIRPYLQRLLKRGSRGERIRALTLLAHFEDEESKRLLLDHATHDDIYVQLAALRGLALIGDVEHLPEALNGLAYSRQHNTLMLTDILKRFGPAAVPSLIGLAQGAAASQVRIAAIMALAAIGDLEATEPLIALTHDSDPNIRAQAIAALGKLGDMRAEEAVLKAVNDAEESIRLAAIQAAGLLKLSKSLPMLAEHLADASWWVRYRAAEAMTKLGTAGMAALRASTHEPAPAGIIASQMLAEVGGA